MWKSRCFVHRIGLIFSLFVVATLFFAALFAVRLPELVERGLFLLGGVMILVSLTEYRCVPCKKVQRLGTLQATNLN